MVENIDERFGRPLSMVLILSPSSVIVTNVSTSGSSWNFNTVSSSTLSANTWTHVALVKSGSGIYLFKDGVLDVWKGGKYNEVRKSHEDKNTKIDPFCETCDQWAGFNIINEYTYKIL